MTREDVSQTRVRIYMYDIPAGLLVFTNWGYWFTGKGPGLNTSSVFNKEKNNLTIYIQDASIDFAHPTTVFKRVYKMKFGKPTTIPGKY
jgi:hypothetical protein